jgi:hypothetical protein
MKRSEQETLLKAILSFEETAAIREASLQAGLASLRNRQKNQRAIRLSAFAVLACIIAAGWVLHRPPARPQPTTASHLPAAPESAAAAQIRFISDEELLALFPGRAVALIGKPGEQQLVFLDAPRKAPPEKL